MVGIDLDNTQNQPSEMDFLLWLFSAGIYLGNMYQRRLKEEKKTMSQRAHEFPNLGLLKRMSM